MVPAITGYTLGASLEPPHPNCSTSDPVFVAESRGEKLAVKVLSLGFPLRDQSRLRYLEVGRSLQNVQSPAVIPVVDVGFCEDGRPYYAMQYVEGEAIEARKTSASAAETRAVLADAAAGLAAAKQVGIAPSVTARHMMVTRHGTRLWNLGIEAWRSWARELVAGTYTASGQYMRHPSLTPGEAKGERTTDANASAQLALIAFSLMTGRPYWDADLEPSGHPMAMLMEAMANAGPPPSGRTQVALPAGFDAWFARCLANEVTDPGDAARAFPA